MEAKKVGEKQQTVIGIYVVLYIHFSLSLFAAKREKESLFSSHKKTFFPFHLFHRKERETKVQNNLSINVFSRCY